MAEVTLNVGGRNHLVACKDGGEEELRALGRRLDSYSHAAGRAAGSGGGERTMLFIALMLADDLAEAERAPGGGVSGAVLDRIAEKLEALAVTLENDGGQA